MSIADYITVTSIFSALFIILGWWLKSRLEGSIGHEYAKILELFKTKNQLRIAALSERLRAHQQAYQLWRDINTYLGKDEIHEVILKCDR